MPEPEHDEDQRQPVLEALRRPGQEQHATIPPSTQTQQAAGDRGPRAHHGQRTAARHRAARGGRSPARSAAATRAPVTAPRRQPPRSSRAAGHGGCARPAGVGRGGRPGTDDRDLGGAGAADVLPLRSLMTDHLRRHARRHPHPPRREAAPVDASTQRDAAPRARSGSIGRCTAGRLTGRSPGPCPSGTRGAAAVDTGQRRGTGRRRRSVTTPPQQVPNTPKRPGNIQARCVTGNRAPCPDITCSDTFSGSPAIFMSRRSSVGHAGRRRSGNGEVSMRTHALARTAHQRRRRSPSTAYATVWLNAVSGARTSQNCRVGCPGDP